ncbi:hypothetical protein CYY_000337 [Polysphondylium violaceum]|uniref:DUF6748 domain-containing protein n=1 Tax=Polysphondylium violaceum TaxID=133409 RepID=A0A8J4Q1R2_9MYCE|nr:hypothetical protein CYY_000337 [Polysphondylium violaceum]
MNKFIFYFISIVFLLSFILVESANSPHPSHPSASPSDTPSVSPSPSPSKLNIRIRIYVTIRRDVRRCAWPQCGGYYLKKVNTDEPEMYVQELGGDDNGIDLEKLDQYVLGGIMVQPQQNENYPTFEVNDVARALPLEGQSTNTMGADDGYYRMAMHGSNAIAYELNTNETYPVENVTEPYTPKFPVQKDWLDSRIMDNSIVAGTMISVTLRIKLVFIRPAHEMNYPCQEVNKYRCEIGYDDTYKRDHNRCLLNDGPCTKIGTCPHVSRRCPKGWKDVYWNAKPNACRKYVCDPAFLNQ